MTYLFQLHLPRQKSFPHEYCHYYFSFLKFYLCLNKGVVIHKFPINTGQIIIITNSNNAYYTQELIMNTFINMEITIIRGRRWEYSGVIVSWANELS